jgi:glycosyltransferase involved in cell wall biosynthesis
MSQPNKGDHNDPLISVIVIDSRSEEHPEWVSKCLSSIAQQSYKPHQVIVIKNTDKSKSIGECWNKAILSSTGEWTLFVGDDDYLSPDYIHTLATYIKRFQTNQQHIDAISTYMTTFDDENYEGMALLQRPPTGCWRTSFFEKLKFDETLTVGVDRTLLEEARKMDAVYVMISHHYGYYYRQHSQGTCTRVKIDPDPTDIYMVAKYPAFAAPIRDRIKKEHNSVQLLNDWKPELAKDAKVIWSDIGLSILSSRLLTIF